MEDNIPLQILKEDPDIADAEERYRQFVADDEIAELTGLSAREIQEIE